MNEQGPLCPALKSDNFTSHTHTHTHCSVVHTNIIKARHNIHTVACVRVLHVTSLSLLSKLPGVEAYGISAGTHAVVT